MCSSSGLKVVSETYLITGFAFLMRIEVLTNWLLTTYGIRGKDSYDSRILLLRRLRWAASAYIYYIKLLMTTVFDPSQKARLSILRQNNICLYIGKESCIL